MSLRVLVVPEDPTYNGAILRPLIEAILADMGKSNAKVTVLANPRLGGYDHAVKSLRTELANRYAFFDLWLFVPDADRATPAAMGALETDLNAQGVRLLCSPAQPEVEIYACAGYRADIALPWTEVRSHARLKESIFAPLLAAKGDARRAGGGRDLMVAQSLKNLPLLYQLCPELGVLRDRIAAALASA